MDVARPGPPARRVELPDATIADEDELSFDVTGHQVAVSVVDATAIIDLDTGERTAPVEGSGGLFGPDGRTIAVNREAGDLPRELDLVDVATDGDDRCSAPTTNASCTAPSADGDMLATAADDRTVSVGDGDRRVVRARRPHRTGALRRVQSGRHLALQHRPRPDDHHLGPRRSTDDRTHGPLSTAGEGSAEAMASRATSRRSSPSVSAELVAVDLASRRAAEALDTGHGVAYVVLPSGGSTVITGGDDGSIRRWNAVDR